MASAAGGRSLLLLGAMILIGVFSLLFYLMHSFHNDRALFSLKLFDNRLYSIGLLGSFLGCIGCGMLPFFLQVSMGFTPFHAGLMMIPIVLGNMGIKRVVVRIVNLFGHRNALVGTTLAFAVVPAVTACPR